jgi:hypothetical protein
MQRPDPNEIVSVDLSDVEIDVLQQGLHQWGGPGRCTPELAKAIGFDPATDVLEESLRLANRLEPTTAMSRIDWLRTLASTEIGFGSDIFGSGVEWETVTGFRDEMTLAVMRGLQRKLIGVVAALVR